MVLNRNDKRKRKEGDLVDLMEPVSESPKRAKVHAQRKFAQGATTVFNVPHSPVKDKEKAKPAVITELITHKRPNTEDFLTFLCFRGTSLLPPDLNFFNIGTRKEKQEPGLSSAVLRKVASSSGNENHKPDLYQKTFNKVKGIITEKKKAQNEIQKNVSKLNTAACTVQALKKKYQEQRLAKQRMKKKFNSPCIMRTRSCTERTVLKRGGALSASQFLPMIERKRQTLRNRTVADKSKKIPSRSKHSLIKSRKKINLIKEKSSDVSNMDSINEEEDVHAEKSMSQGRRSVQKSVQKNVCTRSKTELRRITRSHSRRASSKNHSRRPTRRTKEAAAVYMEILGRKLISPDLDNDDNLSIESFPELPNARKIAQTESEFKAKVKQSALKSTGKGKDCKAAALSNISTKRLNKKKCNNIIFKSKRIIKIQRYCEAESDTESAKSLKASYTRPITRQSLVKYKKPVDRSLRSSKNVAKLDVQSTVNSKVKSQVQNSTKSGKEKYAMKRKRDQNVNKILSDKSTESARKDMKANEIENPPSDEETLGMILNKLRKKRNDNDAAAYNQTKDKSQSRTLLYGTKLEVSKISDDEESFHGFTKKAISTVLNSSQTRVNANLIATEESNENSYALKVRDTPRATSDVSRKCDASKDEARSPEKVLEEAENILNVSVADETQTPSSMKQSEKCNHKADVGLTNIVDMPLSTLHVRKERVNMSTEQIEKWLNDSSLAKEESKLEMEDMSGFRYDEDDEDDDDEDNDEEEDDENEDDDDDDDVDDDDNDDDDDEDDDDGDDGDDDDDGDDGDDDDDDVTTIVTEKMKTDASHLSISTKIQHLVRPVNVTLSKLTDKVNAKSYSGVREKNLSAFPSDPKSSNRKQQSTCRGTANGNNDVRQVVKENSGNKLCKSPFGGGSDVTFESDHNCVQPSASDNSTEKKSQIEKKSIFQGRKGFLAKVKERKVITPNANAFSAENESSVYAFETETEIPVSTPFRRKFRDYAKPKTAATAAAAAKEPEVSKIKEEQASKDSSKDSSKYKESTTSTNDIVDTANEKSVTGSTLKLNNFELQQNFANLSNVQILSLDKLTTSWTDVNHSTSIAVQVNLDDCTNEHDQTEREETSQYKSMEISTQTENSNEQTENDGQLFYIPLQTVTRNGPNLVQSQQVIQGVAVKLGTEGTNGTNQRVLLRAKLVTKPPMSIARCPPVGTVQPTTRTVQNNTTLVTDYSVPSTSSTANPIIAQPSAPSEFNSSSPIKDRDTTQTTNQQNVIPKLSNDLEKHTKVSRTTGKERKFSVDSAKTGKRAQAKSRQKSADQNSSTMGTTFSNAKITSNEACLVEAPTFYPTEKDFQDPLEYIDKIRPTVEKFGICRVVPPPNFKPECKVSDDMRFTAYNQYVHRMLHRWGLNVKEMMAIKKYLATQSITFTHPPWIGGMEVDLPHLYQTVQNLGGLKEVIEKKKWQKVADGMKIPKSAQDRVTKLDDIYCKYLLPYDTLSPEERNKLFNEVEIEWTKKETKALQMQDAASNDNEEEEEEDSSDEIEECIVKGRNMPLNAFYRIARNTQRMWFGENHRSGNEAEGASADEVETAFWKHVTERKRHVCVHAASIDSSGRGFGFSVAKNSPFARHPWNLKVLTNNAGSVLRALGPLMGVTVPTLHVGMLFTACCWYRDPHGLPWIEYLHTGAKKIWYGIPDEHNNNFREALLKMVPQYCKNKTIWLPSDTAMVPPDLLVSNGVSLCQTVQEPGQFIIVFPKAFTSSICTGYVVSESVYFAQPSWLETAEQVFKDIQDSCEPSIFSFEKLLFNIINDSRSNIDILKQILPSVIKIRKREIDCRKQLKHLGLNNKERLPLPDGKQKKGKKVKEEDGDFECEICRANLFVSLVNNSQDDSVYCLTHALQSLSKNKQLLRNCTLMYTYSEGELDDLIHKLKDKIETKSKKNNQMKQIK